VTEQTESLEQALEDHDITLALTTGQLLLLVVGAYILMRFLRGLRG
jgi:hypothetical protein